jgi:hypothetical protein
MAKNNDDTLNMVDQLLSNEEAGVSPRKTGGVKEPWNEKAAKKYKNKKKYTAPPAKPPTDADLILSGWNLEFDPEYKEPYTLGAIVDGIHVQKVGSLYSMACVYCPEYWIFGWGKNVTEAIKDCKKNIAAWKKNNPGKSPLKPKPKKGDKSAADILEEVGL